MEPVIELKGVVAVLGSFPALAGIDLTVNRGEILLLQGPNGAGKTSLLRVCAGLMPIERGEGRILGIDVTTQRQEIRSRVGLLGHTNGLYLDLTVAQNIAFWAATVNASDSEVAAAMKTMHVDGRLASVKASQLSAGQRRRTALASLIVRRAEIWLLDEPHAGLDAAGRDELDGLLRNAVAAGATVVLASHESERVSGLATRTVTIDGGGAR
jgi:ABC-type branched-subunit amino acid transport system ATPase component